MAFFLLMWLLGSTTEGDKKGIADYFNSPLRSRCSAAAAAPAIRRTRQGRRRRTSRTTGQVKRGEIEAERSRVNLKALKAERKRAEGASRSLEGAHRNRIG